MFRQATGARGRRRAAARAAGVVLALLAGITGMSPAAAQECGCRETGIYRPAAVTPAAQQEVSPGAGTYRLQVTSTPEQVSLRVVRADNGQLVEEFLPPSNRVDFGFSPDGDRFFYSHGIPSSHVDQVVLYDLAADRTVFVTNVTAGQSAAFSPHGRWFILNVLRSPTSSETTIVDAVSGQVALYAPMEFETIPGSPGDRFGIMGGGFSSEAADRSYVWAYRQPGGNIQLQLHNLETRVTVLSRPVGGNSFWRFSRCGDTLGLADQSSQAGVEVSTYRTSVRNGLVGTRTFTPIPSLIRFDSTLEHHRVLTYEPSGQEKITNLGANDADTTCPAPLTLEQVSLAPRSVVGGEANVVGTIRLSAPTPSSLVVRLSSSDTGAASVPSSVTMLSGSQTRNFTVTTRQVTAARTVTIQATAAGVTRSATMTVEPGATGGPALDALVIDVTRPGGGSTVTGIVTLAEPAGPGGATVALQSSAPGVAAVAPVATVPATATSVDFSVATQAVLGDSPAVITASSGGISRSVRLMVLAADRTCERSVAEPTTETLKTRTFAAFDDTGTNVDCVANATFTNGITVGAGSSGLAPGTPVALVVALRLDGLLHTSPPLGTGGTTAEGVASYSIFDDEGWSREEGPQVVSFGARFTLQQYEFDADGPNVYWDSSVRLTANGDEEQSATDYSESASPAAVSGAKDTGVMTAVYTTTVGAHLTISGRVSTVSSAYGTGASAVADFSNTFAATTFPAPGFERLALVYDVGPAPENQAPACLDGSGSVTQGAVLTASLACDDPDGDALTFAVVEGPANGSLSPISAEGAFTYTPAAGFTGTDTFSVTADDGRGATATATYTVEVSQGAPTSPTTKDQCKDGGWRQFSDPSFRNQGDCVSWVNRH